MFNITIDTGEKNLPFVKLMKIRRGQTLLEVFLKQGIALRHDCGGVCSCSSCHILVSAGGDLLEPRGKKEEDFLARTSHYSGESRLACQCLLTGTQGELKIRLIPVDADIYIRNDKPKEGFI